MSEIYEKNVDVTSLLALSFHQSRLSFVLAVSRPHRQFSPVQRVRRAAAGDDRRVGVPRTLLRRLVPIVRPDYRVFRQN